MRERRGGDECLGMSSLTKHEKMLLLSIRNRRGWGGGKKINRKCINTNIDNLKFEEIFKVCYIRVKRYRD